MVIGDRGIDVTAMVKIGDKTYNIYVQCKNYYNNNSISSETVEALKGIIAEMPSENAIGVIVVGLETNIPERIMDLFYENFMIGSKIPMMLFKIDDFIENFDVRIKNLEKQGLLFRIIDKRKRTTITGTT
ncbi:hypothetical protein C1646_750280 [Rhizophagus diaphanus]|nr:hypothetical protein C1646_750280 [Rhizophagus diaphanus] [Rhizophagus sp. MUCL 43196]